MKKQLLTAIAVMGCLCGYAQTKGTSALGLGLGLNKQKVTNQSLPTDATSSVSSSEFSLGYGYFIKDNVKIGVDLLHSRINSEYSGTDLGNKIRSYGINLNYQNYISVFKNFYAFAGGRAGYNNAKVTYNQYDGINENSATNRYALGANGGVAWFINKRWAIETELLSANASYSKTESSDDGIDSSQTNFNLSTSGVINNLGFKIFLMF